MRRPLKPRFAARLHSSSTGALKRLETSVPPHAGKTGSPLRPAGEAAPMLRRLRAKFIGLNMALAALVLAASFATICYADYRADINNVHDRLMTAASRSLREPQLIPDAEPFHRSDGGGKGENGDSNENEGESENGDGGKGDAGAEDGAVAPTQDIGAGTNDPSFDPPRIGGPGAIERASLPVAVYYIADRTVMQLTERSGATVPEALLLKAVPDVVSSDESWGFLPDAGLYFAKRGEGPNLIVAFADGSAADGWQSLALALTAVGLGALALLFLLNLVFSRWALRPVQQAWAQQQQFIADASHELKTPLTVILANNAILRQRGGDTIASQRQWIESTQVEAERMQGLVTDMLDLARPAPEGAQASEGPAGIVDLSRLVEGEALTFEAVAFERELMWECAIDKGITVRGNATRLQRAVAVLLDNACKYTNAGGTVTVTLRAHASEAVLSVRNSGEPIDEADLPHLFDRFYRADAARTPQRRRRRKQRWRARRQHRRLRAGAGHRPRHRPSPQGHHRRH